MMRNKSREQRSESGFSMVELLVAMAVFMVIGSAAFTLVRSHIPLFANQQNQAGLNIALRNAAAQMQIDAVNAATGFYTGTGTIPKVGLTVVNRAAGSGCYDSATNTYTANCFDTLNIISADAASGSNPAGSSAGGGTGCVDLNTSPNLYLKPPTGVTAATLSALYKSGDRLLLIKTDGTQMARVDLSQNSSVVSGTVMLTYPVILSTGVYSGDTLNIATSDVAAGGRLGTHFCVSDSWVFKLSSVTYFVDTTQVGSSTNPKLIRRTNNAAWNAAGYDVIAEQIIGFKVGASTWTGSDTTTYSYDATSYLKRWADVRAVRISLIGRAPGNPDGKFKNSFDNGNYKIESVSAVINPRNLSMND